jgi:glutathione synthase/RimK-type ligase-like ATP-grasp enzyme
MTNARIALATTSAARKVDEDHAPLAAALEALGMIVEAPSWDDTEVDWKRYDLVLPRSTWNYTNDYPKFLRWLDQVTRDSWLLNAAATVRWSTHKRYLLDLAAAGLATVATTVSAPGEAWSAPNVAEYVVKPAIGAGSRGARRFLARDELAARAHAAALHAEGREVITQPYLDDVDTYGETAMVYFEGRFSHAVRKGPLLTLGHNSDPDLFLAEQMSVRAPSAAERALADQVLAWLAPRNLLYARVDLIRDRIGAPRILELELAEPSLFLAHAPGSATRLADAIERRLTQRRV